MPGHQLRWSNSRAQPLHHLCMDSITCDSHPDSLCSGVLVTGVIVTPFLTNVRVFIVLSLWHLILSLSKECHACSCWITLAREVSTLVWSWRGRKLPYLHTHSAKLESVVTHFSLAMFQWSWDTAMLSNILGCGEERVSIRELLCHSALKVTWGRFSISSQVYDSRVLATLLSPTPLLNFCSHVPFRYLLLSSSPLIQMPCTHQYPLSKLYWPLETLMSLSTYILLFWKKKLSKTCSENWS